MTKDKIVLVPFPFDDLSAEKVRPAVCLTDPIGQHRHVILAFITSNTNQEFLDPATPDKSFLRESCGLMTRAQALCKYSAKKKIHFNTLQS